MAFYFKKNIPGISIEGAIRVLYVSDPTDKTTLLEICMKNTENHFNNWDAQR